MENRIKQRSSLTRQHIKWFIAGLAAGLAVFAAVACGGPALAQKVLEAEGYYSLKEPEYVEAFAEYVRDGNVASDDSAALRAWNNAWGAYRFEIRDGSRLTFRSVSDNPTREMENVKPPWTSQPYEIVFADGLRQVTVWTAYQAGAYMFILVAAIFLSAGVFVVVNLTGIQRHIGYIARLGREMEMIGSGDLDHEITVKGNDELSYLAQNLEQMRIALKQHIEEEDRLRENNSRMIAKLSHDIRTPLTSIILFMDMIKGGRYKDDAARDYYMERVYSNAKRLAVMAEELYCQVNSKEQPEETAVRFITLRQVVEELEAAAELLKLSGFNVLIKLQPEGAVIENAGDDNNIAEGETAKSADKVAIGIHEFGRVMDNITSNVIRHGLKDEFVTVELESTEDAMNITFRNKVDLSIQKGTKGRGLDNVMQLVERSGGRANVINEKEYFQVNLQLPRKLPVV